MARKHRPIPMNTSAVPILAAVAAVLAVGMWLAPLPILKVPVPPSPPPAPVEPSKPVEAPQARFPVESWSPLAAGLEALREKAPEVPVTDPAATQMPEVIAAPSVPTIPPLGWQFKGTIEGPGSRAALVIVRDGKSRFVFVGQRVPDTGNPGGAPVEIISIESDHMLVRRGETEERIELQKTELPRPGASHLSTAGIAR